MIFLIVPHSVFTTQDNSYYYDILTAMECDCESSGSPSAAVAAVGGVLAAVTVTAIVLLLIVIVVFKRRLHRAEANTTAQPLKRCSYIVWLVYTNTS